MCIHPACLPGVGHGACGEPQARTRPSGRPAGTVGNIPSPGTTQWSQYL